MHVQKVEPFMGISGNKLKENLSWCKRVEMYPIYSNNTCIFYIAVSTTNNICNLAQQCKTPMSFNV